MEQSSNGNGLIVDDDEMSGYRKDANSVVTFNIIYDQKDIEKCPITFHPEMSHQIFGDNESIFGYRSLSINIYYLHNSSRCYVKIKSSGVIDDKINKPDNIMESLNPWLPENYVSTKKEFITMCKTETHDLIYGTVLHEFKDKQKSRLYPNHEVYSTFKITHCDITDENFKSFHSRFETFVIWYIDGANFIDLTDDKWDIFYVYEETINPENQQVFATPIGFCTVYKFFAYPQNIRCRISQFFVLPSHQKRGVGTEMYKTIFSVLQSKSEVVDITVEEPTPTFQLIRDVQDTRLVLKVLDENRMNIMRTHPKKIYNKLELLKIGKKQSKRIYDILYGLELWSDKASYSQYLNNVKSRISKEVFGRLKGSKKFNILKSIESVEEKNAVESEYKCYKNSLETSIKSLKKHLNVE